MKQNNTSILILTIFATIFAGYLFPTVAPAEMDDYWVGKVVSVQGCVQVQRAGTAEWVSVQLNDTYGFGDMIQVQEQSRAAVVLRNEAILRLDQKTTITFSVSDRKEETSLLDLLHGAAHFFSPTPRKLKITTPFVNAAVRGTEFFIRVERTQTLLSVFEGRVAAINKAGSLVLVSGQSATARTGQAPVSQVVVRPRDAVQWAFYYPSILDYQPDDFPGTSTTDWQAMVRKSIGFFRKGELAGAFAGLKEIPDDIRDPLFFTYRAELHLSVGRVDDANADIERALVLNPANGHAFALQSIIAVAQNEKEQALDLAKKAVGFASESSAARVALSYAQQAHFDIKSALVSVKEAAKLDPENALVWARQAELQLSLGNPDRAISAARQAVSLNPDIARTQTVLGFAYLAKIKTRDAKNVFKKAIKLDQAAPLPRLGLGLAKIREGDLKQGRSEVEIAASLGPNNSLVRSYLGKAYFEEKRDKKAKNQLTMAKKLDPLDPTPWFYDAIRKQTTNRPIEALQDLQKSIELNDNRAVYRSRMLLDEDLAVRSASLARIYSDLGFQQLALVEGWNSVNEDPVNYSAHRLLADSYAVLPRHEIARVSELLQSQLLQPINITPVQPSFAETNLLILEGAGPADSSYNEFNPLFHQNQLALQASGVAGGNDTLGDEVVQSGVLGKYSYSFGRFHYETDGFRENNDQDQDIYNIFGQVALSYKTSIQAEYQYKNVDKGDLPLRFDPDEFLSTLRTPERLQLARFGFHHAFAFQSHIIGYLRYGKAEASWKYPPYFEYSSEDEGYDGEIQHLFRSGQFNITSGVGYYDGDCKIKTQTSNFTNIEEPDIQHTNTYVYAQINYPENLTWTLGGSADFFKGAFSNSDQFNPKLGLIWNVFPGTTLRVAGFRTLRRTLLSSQTIEPTQIAGFNQFFNDYEGTDAWRYGVGIDQKIYAKVNVGAEVSSRDIEVPYEDYSLEVWNRTRKVDWEEDLARMYLYWTPQRWLALSAEYQFERFNRDLDYTGGDNLNKIKTHRFPLAISLFSSLGFSSQMKATYIDQKGEFGNRGSGVTSGNDQFWIVDAFIRYWLPKRWGFITLEACNVFDEDFQFQDTDPAHPLIYPERLILTRLTLAF